MTTTAVFSPKAILHKVRRGVSSMRKKMHKKVCTPFVQPNDAVLEAIFSKMDLHERFRMSMLNHRTNRIVDRMAVVLPLLLVRDHGNVGLELVTDNVELLVGEILRRCGGFKIQAGDRVIIPYEHVDRVLHNILLRITGVDVLWLEAGIRNVQVAEAVVSFFQKLQENGCRRKFQIEQLTVVGPTKPTDIESLSKLILLARKNLQILRLRTVRVHSDHEARTLWAAVQHCSSLRQLQYEPCRLDRWSHNHLPEALEKKKLISLIVTGVAEMCPENVVKMAGSSNLVELAVVGDKLPVSMYLNAKARNIVKGLDSLLIQIDPSHDLEDAQIHKALLQTLHTLPETSVLEVIHICAGNIAETARMISFWLHLARDTDRAVKLKLEDCSQERQDAAVGRLLRKSRDSRKADWTPKGISLTMGKGHLLVLDKHTWFGDEE